jgi:hypothetical protein
MRRNRLNKSDDLDDMVRGFYFWGLFAKQPSRGFSNTWRNRMGGKGIISNVSIEGVMTLRSMFWLGSSFWRRRMGGKGGE